jgi:hypothetical protein
MINVLQKNGHFLIKDLRWVIVNQEETFVINAVGIK